MFSLHDFVLKTIKGMVGTLPDFKVQEYALGWYTRGTITEADLAEINALIEAQYPAEEEMAEEGAEENGVQG